ncbi:MAG: 1-(5-phosphoribosyl)-5-[(5-phosphoribosylamino)methylideneamino]imidazole-4-carboxamide isomerase [Hyphomonadaceae bacterium]
MILYPAIDLKEGACVRLIEGRMETAATMSADPGAQAAAFAAAGFEWIHVVDLDGAFAGASRNSAAVAQILASAKVPVQLGGGIRSMENIRHWLEAGVARVILGTAAARDPTLVREAARAFPGRIAVGIDARNGKVAIAGWAEETEMNAVDLARHYEDAGIAALIVTDISRDGKKTGLNVELTGQMADAVSVPVIASGGLASVADILALKARPGRPIHGAILGRALYDGDITAPEALAAALAAAA